MEAEPTELFSAAFGALQAGDAAALDTLLSREAALAVQRDRSGNTLLNLAVSVAAKAERGAALAMIETLLGRGADVNEANVHGWTPLHQAAYSNQCDVAAVLIARGAEATREAHGGGGTPLVAALFWGHREVAELLSRYSAAPGNLRVAAGLGDLVLLAQCIVAENQLTRQAGAARGFYRPHSGFPEWRPSGDPQEILDESLVWACKSGRTAILPPLLEAGARLDCDPYRGSPLIWAAVRNRLETAAWLIDRGANVNLKATFGGATHGEGVTALHMAAQSGHLAMVQLLVSRGADVTIRDDLYHSDAAGAANHFGQTAVRAYLDTVALRGD